LACCFLLSDLWKLHNLLLGSVQFGSSVVSALAEVKQKVASKQLRGFICDAGLISSLEIPERLVFVGVLV